MIFLFFITVMTVVAVPSPDSYRWGGGGGGSGSGRTTEAPAAEDPMSGHTMAPGAKGHPPAAEVASSIVRGGGEGTSPEGGLLATLASGATADAPEGAVLGTEASPPPTRSVKLRSGLSGLGAWEEVPHNTSISPGPRGQAPALSSESAELP
jgi:hypothetical protein